MPMSRSSAPIFLRAPFSLFCPNSFYRFFFTSPLRSKPRALLNSYFYTLVALSYSRTRARRANSTLREERRKEGSLSLGCEMDGAAMLGFNKRRADGRDRSDKPRALQLKSRKLNPVTTTCYVQILGTGMDTQDTSPSVFLFFDKQRFIFNAGEGLQRFCTEHKIKLSKVDHIFLTRVSSETAGGLPGLLLTLAGIGEVGMSVNIWGPSDLKYLVDAMQSFIPNAAMVHTHSFGEALSTVEDSGLDHVQASPVKPIVLIDDEVIRLSAIPLRPNYFGGSFMKPGDVAVVYTCELPEIKGKFDPEKAASLGLKPGPKFRELQLGNTVMSDHLDILVHSSDVLGPSLPGPIVLLVDCPTPSHTQGLFSAQSLQSYYADSQDCQAEGIKFVNCVIHLGPASVTKKADYQIWMKRFGNAHHIIAGHEMKNVETPILKSSARISTRLNYLCPQLFPSSGFWSLKDEVKFSIKSSIVPCKEHSSDVDESFSAENLLKYHLRPYSRLGFDQTATPSFLNRMQILNELLSEIPEIKEISELVSSLWRNHAENKGLKQPRTKETLHLDENLEDQRDIASKEGIPCLNFNHKPELGDFADIPACLNNISREDMEIVLLGTGSSQPSKYRNVSSIFVNLFSKGSLLLDCGEGTLAQLKRRYGIEGADNVVRTLNLIWTSHIHADHHTGLARILSHRCQLLRDKPHEPLLVIGPKPLKRFLDAYSRLEDLDMLFLDCRHTTTDVYGESEPKGAEPMLPGSLADTSTSMPALWRLKELLQEAGLEALYSVPVIHCPQAFAVVLKAAERLNNAGKVIPGWKLVYSGDTRPCKALIDASQNATVLIHEATFEDSLREEAVARNHSTTEEAILVGSAAGAYRIILTHFSQRYPKIPVFDEAHMHNTCIGFDLMSVNLADLPLLPKMLPFLKLLFRNELATAGESDDDAIMDLAASQQ